MSQYTVDDLRKTVSTCLGTANAQALAQDRLEHPFTDLGYDSLAVYEIATRIEDELGLAISDAEIDRLNTPASLLDMVNSKLAGV
ncbi:acyl carrier protein [Kutzneria sp. NPDC051319]|uniref:acyl carrier protein n=1 Tax=Kutzneria sp. NPDC051319 TaxID=3155047 RepID=UPI00343D8FBA